MAERPEKMTIRDTSQRISIDYIESLPVDKSTGCWIYTGDNKIKGYGLVWHNGKSFYLHRISAYLWMGGFNIYTDHNVIVCHKCNNPSCFNPEHLYLGTDSSNMLDAVKAKTHVQARKTHCQCGLPYDEIAHRPGGKLERRCSYCRRRRTRESRERAKAKRNNI